MSKNTIIQIVLLAAILVIGLTLFVHVSDSRHPRTFETLAKEELITLKKLESAYFNSVADEALTLIKTKLDPHTVLSTFPEQIKIIRQSHREELLDIERYLYSLKLGTGFIQGYVERLRDDVLHYALEQMIKKSSKMGSAHN